MFKVIKPLATVIIVPGSLPDVIRTFNHEILEVSLYGQAMHLYVFTRVNVPVSFVEQIHPMGNRTVKRIVIVEIEAFVCLGFHKRFPEACDFRREIFHRFHHVNMVAYLGYKLVALLAAKVNFLHKVRLQQQIFQCIKQLLVFTGAFSNFRLRLSTNRRSEKMYSKSKKNYASHG